MNSISHPWFSWNGVKNEDMGVLMVSAPTRQHPFLNGEKKTIAGRDGFVYITDDTYGAVTVKQDIVIPSLDDVPAALNWLRGSGELIFSDAPERKYEGIIITSASRSSVAKRLEGQKMSITWTCQPFLKSATASDDQQDYTITTSGAYIPKNGHVTAYPTIAITATNGCNNAFIQIGNNAMNVTVASGYPLYIDCEAKIAYVYNSGAMQFAGTQITFPETNGGWFELSPDENTAVTFSGGITRVDVWCNWRWLA